VESGRFMAWNEVKRARNEAGTSKGAAEDSPEKNQKRWRARAPALREILLKIRF